MGGQGKVQGVRGEPLVLFAGLGILWHALGGLEHTAGIHGGCPIMPWGNEPCPPCVLHSTSHVSRT